MPENKLQHYVPRCYLKPFSIGGLRGKGKAIHLYNIERDAFIRNAPIKGQCSRDYFYGADGEVEKLLQLAEGMYAEILRISVSNPGSLSEDNLFGLRFFAVLQTFRSFGYVQKLLSLSDKMQEQFAAAIPKRDLPPPMIDGVQDAVSTCMRHFASMSKNYVDLQVRIALNKTDTDFIICDDPAIHTNRFHYQRLQSHSFGMASSGTMIFLPMTPHLLVMIYDQNCYSVPDRSGEIALIERRQDVDAFNEMQFLNARDNIYFSDWETRETVRAQAISAKPRRPIDWNAVRIFNRDADVPGAERFIQGDKLILDGETTNLLGFSQVRVSPSTWPRTLSLRSRISTVDTETGAGLIRPNHPFLKEMLADQRH